MRIDNLALTRKQYEEIMLEIWEYHRFGGLSKSDKEPCRNIKYVDPVWDMRDGRCFAITFRGLCTVNFDFRQSDRSMFERIMDWLDGDKPEDVEADVEMRLA
jgi:hypothetical protein